jgi:hypothetical protein
MGLWLMGSVSLAIVATENFYTIDRLLEAKANPSFSAAVERLGTTQARDLLRYLSSELNRLYFQFWNVAQLAIGVLVLWLVVRLPDRPKVKWSVVAMIGIGIFLTVAITPPMLSVGRALDFMPRDPVPAQLRSFGLLHAAYTVLDGVQLILGVLVVLWMKGSKD